MSGYPKLASEAEMARNIVQGALTDLAEIEARWPPSKRGSNCQRLMESLRGRLETAEQCLSDGLGDRT